MKISPSMDLSQLAERMGTLLPPAADEATAAECREMRTILCDSPYQTTEEIPDRVVRLEDGATVPAHSASNQEKHTKSTAAAVSLGL